MTSIKICGIKSIDEIEYLNQTLPEFAGFVFAKSKRQVDKQKAKTLKEKLDIKIRAVGVFVNEEIDFVAQLANENIIDLIQLHGDEDKEYIINLKSKTKAPIIKAIRVDNEVNLEKIKMLEADFYLFDTFVKNEYGGSGKSFNWDLIKNFEKPFFLAGGLNSSNIEDAIEAAKPSCVDVSSGVEVGNSKNLEKILEIIQIVREKK
jgi:phosphoribosylanthranilate isomerase